MVKPLILIRNHWVSLTILILLSITCLSLWPLNDFESVPGSDKVHHLIAYAALMFPTALRKPPYWVLYGLLFLAFSGVIELVQPYVNRYGEWADMLANATGVACVACPTPASPW
jgi:hypothetical protein